MSKTEFFDLCKRSFCENGLERCLSDDTLNKLFSLCEIFLETNKKMNLSAIRDEKLVVSRHFADCLLSAGNFPFGTSVLDVGSGGGMPALPLAIARPDLKITALDATRKKTAFIEKAAQLLDLSNISVLTGRAEELARTPLRESFDCVTARAVAELRTLLEICVPFAKPNGRFVAMKGKNAEVELASAATAMKKMKCSVLPYEKEILRDPDGETSERYTLVFVKNAKTDAIYPRKYAQIVKDPL